MSRNKDDKIFGEGMFLVVDSNDEIGYRFLNLQEVDDLSKLKRSSYKMILWRPNSSFEISYEATATIGRILHPKLSKGKDFEEAADELKRNGFEVYDFRTHE